MSKENIENWVFSKTNKTYLQTNSVKDGQVHWYLTKEPDTVEPAYHIEITQNAKGLLDTIAHLSEKKWVDYAQFLEALLPVIRTIAWK
ncbi:hypothetical protein D3C87_605320 [compost metagenome]